MKLMCSASFRCVAVVFLAFGICESMSASARANGPEDASGTRSIDTPEGLRVSVKMISPVTQMTDLQIVCILKHDPKGDKYLEAMKDLDEKLGGVISSLRDRGEFVGNMGETLLFDPPPGAIGARRVLFIGVGDESSLSLDRIRQVGAIAAREAIRLRMTNAAFAPALRDQGSDRIDVAEGGGAFAEQFVLAFDTEKRLQAEGLSPPCQLKEITMEAGSNYFAGVSKGVATAIVAATAQLEQRDQAPYHASAPRK